MMRNRNIRFHDYQIEYLERKKKEGSNPSELIRRLLDKKIDDDFFKQ